MTFDLKIPWQEYFLMANYHAIITPKKTSSKCLCHWDFYFKDFIFHFKMFNLVLLKISSITFCSCFLHMFPSVSLISLKILEIDFLIVCVWNFHDLKSPYKSVSVLWMWVCKFLFKFLLMVLYFLVHLVHFLVASHYPSNCIYENSLGLGKKLCSSETIFVSTMHFVAWLFLDHSQLNAWVEVF